MKLQGSLPDPNSKVRRALALLADQGEMTLPAYYGMLQSLCDTKQQRVNLNGELQKRGFVERFVRVKE